MNCSLGQRHRLLRLHDFDIRHDTGGEAIARLRQLQRGQFPGAGRRGELLLG